MRIKASVAAINGRDSVMSLSRWRRQRVFICVCLCSSAVRFFARPGPLFPLGDRQRLAPRSCSAQKDSILVRELSSDLQDSIIQFNFSLQHPGQVHAVRHHDQHCLFVLL